MYMYIMEYEELDWDKKPLHRIGCFSTKRRAFKLLRTLVQKKYTALGDECIFCDVVVRKSRDRVYVDLDGDTWTDTWRFRVVRVKVDEEHADELLG